MVTIIMVTLRRRGAKPIDFLMQKFSGRIFKNNIYAYWLRYVDLITVSVCRYKDGPYSDWDNSLQSLTVRNWINGEAAA